MAAELLLPTARASDANGNPYNGAKWYFYATGTTTPQNVYADAALNTSLGATVTADSAGKFVPIYFDASLTYRGICKDSSGAVTLHDIDPINSSIYSGLTSSTGSSLVGFLQAGTGAVARTSQDKHRDIVHVKDFGAVGDGVTDDTTAIEKAITYILANPGYELEFDETTYLVGSSTTNGNSVFTLVGGTGFTMRGRPTFRVTGTNAKGVILFHVQMDNVDIEYVKAVGDAWTVPNVTAAIAVGITTVYVQNPSAGTTISGFKLGEVVTENCTWAVLFDANTKTYGLSADVYIGNINATNTVYALNCAQSPKNLVCKQVLCDNVFRGYFAYGVDNHVVNVQFKSTYTGIFAGGTCANITVYTESSSGSYAYRVADTRNINLKVFNTSLRPTLQLSTVTEATTDADQGMYNIHAEAISTSGNPLKIVNSVGAVTDTSTAFASPKRNIFVRAQGPGAALDSSDYGVFNTTNCYGLTLDAGNFLDSAVAARQSMLTSGWNIYDATYGLQVDKRFGVGKAGSTSYLQFAINEDPHLSIGSDSSNITRWRAGSAHGWYLGGSLSYYMTTTAFYPWTDNAAALGGGSNRWTVVYATTGTINTSDEREKVWRGAPNEAELRAARRIIGELGFYQWEDAVAVKGSDARYHFGARAQRVWTIMAEEGLVDPIMDGRPGKTPYAFLCFDEWEDGNRFGLRVDQLTLFLIAAQEARLAALETKRRGGK